MNEEVNKADEIIQQGGIILYPTDTVWGLGCDTTDAAAVKKIYDLKQRDDSKSLIILLAEAKDILQYVADPLPDIIGMVKSFERPTTVIYPGAINLPANLVNNDGSIAIRVTKDPFCKMLIKRMKKPLVSTSANISGQPTGQSFCDVSEEIKNEVDYIVKYRQEEKIHAQPSKIIRIQADGHMDIIRN